jgi:hypothetical protein
MTHEAWDEAWDVVQNVVAAAVLEEATVSS